MSVVTHLLVDLVTIQRLQETSVGHGRFTNTMVTIGSSVPFRIAPANAAERRDSERLDTPCSHVGYCEQDVDIARDDVVIRAGISYRVTGRLPPSLPYFLKVTLDETQKAEI